MVGSASKGVLVLRVWFLDPSSSIEVRNDYLVKKTDVIIHYINGFRILSDLSDFPLKTLGIAQRRRTSLEFLWKNGQFP